MVLRSTSLLGDDPTSERAIPTFGGCMTDKQPQSLQTRQYDRQRGYTEKREVENEAFCTGVTELVDAGFTRARCHA